MLACTPSLVIQWLYHRLGICAKAGGGYRRLKVQKGLVQQVGWVRLCLAGWLAGWLCTCLCVCGWVSVCVCVCVCVGAGPGVCVVRAYVRAWASLSVRSA